MAGATAGERLDNTYLQVYVQRMSQRAKIFSTGGSQAVRLPREFRFPDDAVEVAVRREGNRVVLEPIDEWPEKFFEKLGVWDGIIERPRGGKPRSPFE